MLLGQKVILWFLGLILIPILALGLLFFFAFNNYIYDEIRGNLEYTAKVQQERVQEEVEGYSRLLNAYTTRLLLPNTVDHYNRTKDQNDINMLNASLEASVNANKQYLQISILNLSGEVLASSDDGEIGKDYSNQRYFQQHKKHNSTLDEISHGEDGKLRVYLSGPIVLEREPVGVVSIVHSAEELQRIADDYSALGETGETMIVRELDNGAIQQVANLRFDRDASLKRMIDSSGTSSPAMQAINGKDQMFNDVKDYRGQSTLSVSKNIEGINWGVVVKIDRSEAFEPLHTFTAIAVSIVFVILALGVFVAQYASRVLTDPLIVLAIEVRKMSEGNLGTRVDLEASNIAPNSEFGVLARAFNNMAENLENLDKMKTEFVMLTSHQLRTPASSVKGFLSMLMDGYAKPGSNESRELLESAYKENEQQLHLINQILAVMQAENHQEKLKKTNVNIIQIIRSIIKQVHPIALEREQRITLDAPKKTRMIKGDPEKLGMIVENLIVNAIKYSPNGTKITVAVKYKKSGMMLEVTDEGVGISAKDIDNLFKKFSRLNNPHSDGSQSSGLGLYLVRKLVDQHGGHISASSPGLGKGSTFSVWLPKNAK